MVSSYLTATAFLFGGLLSGMDRKLSSRKEELIHEYQKTRKMPRKKKKRERRRLNKEYSMLVMLESVNPFNNFKI